MSAGRFIALVYGSVLLVVLALLPLRAFAIAPPAGAGWINCPGVLVNYGGGEYYRTCTFPAESGVTYNVTYSWNCGAPEWWTDAEGVASWSVSVPTYCYSGSTVIVNPDIGVVMYQRIAEPPDPSASAASSSASSPATEGTVSRAADLIEVLVYAMFPALFALGYMGGRQR